MTKQERKYLVKSFTKIKKILSNKKISQSQYSATDHFYGRQKGNNVTKLVKYSDKLEIHVLEEEDGIYLLKKTIPMKTVNEGINWLRNSGFSVIDIVKMESITYDYLGGLVRLYLIDGWLHSVILSHDNEKLSEVEKKLGIKKADVIAQPYNVYLESLGKLRTMMNYS